jgi:PmbA protein
MPKRPSAPDRFSYSQATLDQLTQDALAYAKRKGASDADVEVSESYGLNVTVRNRKLDTIEHTRDKGLSVSVFLGQRKGYASSTDFSSTAMQAAVDAALDIARYTAEDDAAGLADPSELARGWQDPQLFYPWDMDVDAAVALATRAEKAAFAVSPMVRNSDGSSVSTHHLRFAHANSRGFQGGYSTTRHYLSSSVIAAPRKNDFDGMESGYWYAERRDPKDFPTPEAIGAYGAERALARLNARKMDTLECPVVFEAPLAAGLVGSFIGAASGGSLYRKASFLQDSLGQQIFAIHIHIDEDPSTFKGLASGPFDDDGVATRARQVVSGGVLNGYFLSVYSARKLGMKTTGNAGGCHNLSLRSTVDDNLAQLLKRMGRGLLVTDLMGQGVNGVTGDYSRGAAGYWVEGGTIQYPVSEVTIAGNLKAMYQGMVAVGNDRLTRGSISTGSVLVDSMKVAGN